MTSKKAKKPVRKALGDDDLQVPPTPLLTLQTAPRDAAVLAREHGRFELRRLMEMLRIHPDAQSTLLCLPHAEMSERIAKSLVAYDGKQDRIARLCASWPVEVREAVARIRVAGLVRKEDVLALVNAHIPYGEFREVLEDY